MPELDIDSFIAANSNRSFQRAYLFRYMPSFPTSITGLTLRDINYLVRAVTLPSSSLEEQIIELQGFDFKMAGKKIYDDFTITFNCDEGGQLRRMFEKWNQLIHDTKTHKHALPDEYMITQEFDLLGMDGEVSMAYKLYGAWPKVISQMSFDHSTNDVAQFDLTFSYQYHEMVENTGGGGPI